MLKDPGRGATLEVVVSRMMNVRNAEGGDGVRILAVSATVPNLKDFSVWLRDGYGRDAVILYLYV